MNPRRNRGFALVFVLSIGLLLLVLGAILYRLVSQHHDEITHFTESTAAGDIAEAGVGFAIQEIRRAFEVGTLAGSPSPLARKFLQPGPVPTGSIVSTFDMSWNYRLAQAAAEIDPAASICVDAWFEGFEDAETDPTQWADPVAKRGMLVISSTGAFREVSRTLVVRRPIFAGSMLPPVATKFTLRIGDGNRCSDGRFNTTLNDHCGRYLDGDHPIIAYNHPLPDDPFTPQAAQENESEDSYQSRGWIWIGGGEVRLNLTAGDQEAGEIFELYPISDAGICKPGMFRTPAAALPDHFAPTLSLQWDCPLGMPAAVKEFRFGHSFRLEGFHDKNPTVEHDAMYEGNLLPPAIQTKYGSKSSSLHLFGDGRKGYRSRTKILGNVNAAFMRVGTLEVEPQTPDTLTLFNTASPAPLYLLPGIDDSNWSAGLPIRESSGRSVGGPLVNIGNLFPEYDAYAGLMSDIVEFPYASMYNFMGETRLPQEQRVYPPSASLLGFDEGETIDLLKGDTLLYHGPVSATPSLEVVSKRILVELATIGEFWDRFYDPVERVLRLQSAVRIINSQASPFIVPPPGLPNPLVIEGSGIILLDRGDVTCRGERLSGLANALTVIAPNAHTVQLEQYDEHQINVVAPAARLVIRDPCRIYGSLEVGDVLQTGGGKGGRITYREIQDPTHEDPNGLDARLFNRACLADADVNWHE